jgi:hypothetical protein
MFALLLILATGCKNSCQQLCGDIRDYAKECGFDFTGDQLQQCYQEHRRAELEEGEAASCRDIAPNVQEEWTCEDFEAYFDSVSADDGNEG